MTEGKSITTTKSDIATATTSLLQDAVGLKKAVERISKMGDPIGFGVCHQRCSGEPAGNDDDDDCGDPEDEEETEDTEPEKRRKRKQEPRALGRSDVKALRACFEGCMVAHEFNVSTDEDATLRILSKTYAPGKLTRSDVEMLYQTASNAGFGNMKTMTTEHDDAVRRSKEIVDFTAPRSWVQSITQEWEFGLGVPPGWEVSVMPYKLNLYTKGDHFAVHKDTPEKDMVGTALVCVYDDMPDADGSYLLILHGCTNKPGWAGSQRGDALAFYGDVEHGVPEIKEDGFRVNMAFKVFMREKAAESTSESKTTTSCVASRGETVIDGVHARVTGATSKDTSVRVARIHQVTERLKKLMKQWPKPFGILLAHEYTVEDRVAKGADVCIMEAVACTGKLERFPVVVTVNQTWDYDERPEDTSCLVYRADDDAVRAALADIRKKKRGKKKRAGEQEPPIPFLLLRDGGVWAHSCEEAVEHTGNESRAGDRSSVYLNNAVVCR